MKKKSNLWMADWRDEQGRRHRKGFPTKQQAQRHQARQARDTAAKKAPPSATSP